MFWNWCSANHLIGDIWKRKQTNSMLDVVATIRLLILWHMPLVEVHHLFLFCFSGTPTFCTLIQTSHEAADLCFPRLGLEVRRKNHFLPGQYGLIIR
jgi:hypothetical protein